MVERLEKWCKDQAWGPAEATEGRCSFFRSIQSLQNIVLFIISSWKEYKRICSGVEELLTGRVDCAEAWYGMRCAISRGAGFSAPCAYMSKQLPRDDFCW
jgi:hypothetical protein